jgi:hypothetical protein
MTCSRGNWHHIIQTGLNMFSHRFRFWLMTINSRLVYWQLRWFVNYIVINAVVCMRLLIQKRWICILWTFQVYEISALHFVPHRDARFSLQVDPKSGHVVVGEVASGQFFSEYLGFPLPIFVPPTVLYSLITLSSPLYSIAKLQKHNKFWEELITYFPLKQLGPQKKRTPPAILHYRRNVYMFPSNDTGIYRQTHRFRQN